MGGVYGLRQGKKILIPPPIIDPQLGRPPRVRRRGPNEPKKTKHSRVGVVIKCSKCHLPGHNNRSCGKPKKPRSQGKGIRKRREYMKSGLADESGGDVNLSMEIGEGSGEPTREQVQISEQVQQGDTDTFWGNNIDEFIQMESQPVEGTFRGEMGQYFANVGPSQPQEHASKKTAQYTIKVTATKKVVRRSIRINNSPKKGLLRVDFMDLTETPSDTIYCVILKAHEGPNNLSKGHIYKFYASS